MRKEHFLTYLAGIAFAILSLTCLFGLTSLIFLNSQEKLSDVVIAVFTVSIATFNGAVAYAAYLPYKRWVKSDYIDDAKNLLYTYLDYLMTNQAIINELHLYFTDFLFDINSLHKVNKNTAIEMIDKHIKKFNSMDEKYLSEINKMHHDNVKVLRFFKLTNLFSPELESEDKLIYNSADIYINSSNLIRGMKSLCENLKGRVLMNEGELRNFLLRLKNYKDNSTIIIDPKKILEPTRLLFTKYEVGNERSDYIHVLDENLAIFICKLQELHESNDYDLFTKGIYQCEFIPSIIDDKEVSFFSLEHTENLLKEKFSYLFSGNKKVSR